MSFFGRRFDLRNSTVAGTTKAERSRAALDITAWADRLGFVFVGLSEHHGAPDSDLPSPLTSTRCFPAVLRDQAAEAAAVGCGAGACMVSWHARPR